MAGSNYKLIVGSSVGLQFGNNYSGHIISPFSIWRHSVAGKHGLNPDECQDTLCSILNGIYELVGGLVIKRLRVLGVPDLESGSASLLSLLLSTRRGSESHREVQYFPRAII